MKMAGMTYEKWLSACDKGDVKTALMEEKGNVRLVRTWLPHVAGTTYHVWTGDDYWYFVTYAAAKKYYDWRVMERELFREGGDLEWMRC